MPKVEIEQFSAARDSYTYLVRHRGSNSAAIIDPSFSGPTVDAISPLGWRPVYIINTHHHDDQTGGNRDLKQAFGLRVCGPALEADKIPDIDRKLTGGETFKLGEAEGKIIDVGGHTVGHIAIWFHRTNALFCGDALLVLGCGRRLEGSAAQMWDSLKRLRELPPETQVYCAHENTKTNLAFALELDPGNRKLQERADEIHAALKRGGATVPTLLGDEVLTNPFLRADDPTFQEVIGMAGADAVEVFATLRKKRDDF
ncbi:MAG: hydroxyacylglutathione hydrolase [Alphaproteobacteria bacterium]|jgi:hydroxyacylglutathione hydrolase|nr:hydroxyacylglutathione hydrolase [Alphaproteobacteria bacterium]HJP22336.1 hydroxyacylglutathione hydrolase [Alphaproteobacteria bacterium]